MTLDGVHAVAHITRKVRRDEFPSATYVFVADQLHLPKGLNNVTLAGTLDNGVTTFVSSKAVLNIPYAASVKGPLHSYMGGGTIYKALSKIEAKHPTVVIPSSNAKAVSQSANPAPGHLAKLKVSYAPVVHSTGKATEAVADRTPPGGLDQAGGCRGRRRVVQGLEPPQAQHERLPGRCRFPRHGPGSHPRRRLRTPRIDDGRAGGEIAVGDSPPARAAPPA